MPRDQRLFMTFPIDFPDHPKVKPLPVLAKWTFVEMNAYSRRLNLDGMIPAATAHAMWPKKVLAVLVESHPDRPLVMLVDGVYVIRDYAEHQETSESIAHRRAVNAANGAKGGRPPKSKRTETQSVSETEPSDKQSQSQSTEVEKTDDGDSHPPVTEVDAGKADEDEDFVRVEAGKLGIRRLGRIRTAFERVTGPLPSEAHVIDLTRAVMNLALERVRSVEAYVEAACVNSPNQVLAEWAKIGGAA